MKIFLKKTKLQKGYSQNKLNCSFSWIIIRTILLHKVINIKTKTLRFIHFNLDAKITLSNNGSEGMYWWITNIMSSFQYIHVPDPDIIIPSDSPLTSHSHRHYHSHWLYYIKMAYKRRKNFIRLEIESIWDQSNYLLELRAILLGVMTCKSKT